MHVICRFDGLDVDVDVDEHTTLASLRQQVCAAAGLSSGSGVFDLHGLASDADLASLSAGDVVHASPHPRALAHQRLADAGLAATDGAFHVACGGNDGAGEEDALSVRVVADYLQAGFDAGGEGGRATLPLPHVVAAVLRGDAAVVEALLQGGASPHARLRGVLPCLEVAASRGFADVVEVLVRHGADPRRDAAPLHAASARGFEDVVEVLLRGSGGATAAAAAADKNVLRVAIEGGHAGIVRRLLEAGADGSGWVLDGSPLWLAVSRRRVGCVRELLAHGVSVTEEEVQELVEGVDGTDGDAVELRRLLWKAVEGEGEG